MYLCRLEGSEIQLCEGASKRRKERKERDSADGDDSCKTDDHEGTYLPN